MIEWYDWAGGREAMLRFGPASGPVVIVAPALFEESNRTRAFLISILRRLAARGIASALPDLPGQGESLVPTEHASLAHLREAFAAATGHLRRQRPVSTTIAVRAGALVDATADAPARWRLSPMNGRQTVDELRRAARVSGTMEATFDTRLDVDGGLIEIAGNSISASFLAELRDADVPADDPGLRRTVRLDSDPRPADRKLPGAPLWRRSEPATDDALAALLADDIADWIARCVA